MPPLKPKLPIPIEATTHADSRVNIPTGELGDLRHRAGDEDAGASLYSTRSRPFPRPESKRIAVKVINHYGDEVLKVYAM